MNTKPARVDVEWELKMRDIMRERLSKKLSNVTPKDIGLSEMTRLTLRCPSWNQIEKELRNLPKKK